MNFELAEEHRMLKDLVRKFVDSELMPLESGVLQKESSGQGSYLTAEQLAKVDAVIFANTTGDLAIPDREGFIRWVEQGHALIGMHSCSDTFHGFPAFYGMLGGLFLTHGAQVTVDMANQDPAHPDGVEVTQHAL